MSDTVFYTHDDGSIGISIGDGRVIHPSGRIQRIDASWSRTADLCEDDLSSEAVIVLLTKIRARNRAENDMHMTETFLNLIRSIKNRK